MQNVIPQTSCSKSIKFTSKLGVDDICKETI